MSYELLKLVTSAQTLFLVQKLKLLSCDFLGQP